MSPQPPGGGGSIVVTVQQTSLDSWLRMVVSPRRWIAATPVISTEMEHTFHALSPSVAVLRPGFQPVNR